MVRTLTEMGAFILEMQRHIGKDIFSLTRIVLVRLDAPEEWAESQGVGQDGGLPYLPVVGVPELSRPNLHL